MRRLLQLKQALVYLYDEWFANAILDDCGGTDNKMNNSIWEVEDIINNNSPTLSLLPTHQHPPTANTIYYVLHFTIDWTMKGECCIIQLPTSHQSCLGKTPEANRIADVCLQRRQNVKHS